MIMVITIIIIEDPIPYDNRWIEFFDSLEGVFDVLGFTVLDIVGFNVPDIVGYNVFDIVEFSVFDILGYSVSDIW